MTTIITRAAKSSPLSSTEVDSNFVNLKTTADAALPKAGGALTGAVTTNSTIDGRDVSVDGTKLDGIEANATADQTNAEIRTAVEAASDSNVFTDADHSKLDGIATNANNYVLPSGYATETYVNTQVTNLVDSSPATLNTLNELAAALGDDPNFATTTANSIGTKAALSGAAFTGAITTNSTIDGRDVATDGTKLDGIEASADVTDATNVTAAGALMDSEVTNLAQVKAFDSSDYATAAQGTTANAALPKSGGTLTGGLLGTTANFSGSVVADGLTVDSTTGFSWLPVSTAGAKLGAIGTGSSVIFNTPSVNANYGSGLAIDGSYASGLSSVNIKAFGAKYNSYGSELNLFTSSGTSLLKRLAIASNGDISFYDSSGSSQNLFWDSSTSRLGLGTTAPSAPLAVHSALSGGGVIAEFRSTGNSHSIIDLRADGTGDPKIFFDLNGATPFAIGVDNSDGDKFKISNNYNLGTNDRLTIDSAGNINIGSSLMVGSTSAPTAKLQAQVNNTATPAQIATDSNAVLLLENTNASGSAGIRLRGGNGAGVLMYGENNSTDKFYLSPRNDTGKSFTLDHVGNGVFAGTVTANAGVVVDNITIDGTEIDSSSSLLLDIAGNLTINVDGSTVSLNDDSINFGQFYQNASGNFNIYSPTSNKDILFLGNDGGSTVTALTLDMSAGGTAYFADDVRLTDNHAIRLGTDADIVFYHDNSNGYLENGTGSLTLDVAGETNIDSATSGIVRLKQSGTNYGTLFHDSNKFYIKSNISDGDLIFQGNDGGSAITALTLNMSAAGAATFNAGINVNGTVTANNLTMLDDEFIRLGNSNDFVIVHSSSENIIQAAVSDQDIIFKGNDGGSTITALTLDMSAAGAATFNSSVTADGLTVSGNITNTGNNYFADATSGYFFAGGGSFANGIYGYGTNNARIDTNSKIRINIASNGDISFYEDTGTTPKFFWDASAERLGIGSSSPSQDLEILNGTTGAGIRLAATGTAYWDIERDSTSGHLTFTDDGAGTVLTVGQDGNVGIGATGRLMSGYDGNSKTLTVYDSDGSAQSGYLELASVANNNGYNAGAITFVNNANSNNSSPESANSKTVAQIRAETVTSDNNAGDDAGSSLVIFTKPEAGGLAERARLTSGGTLLVGKTGSNVGTAGHEFLNYGRSIHTVNASTVQIINRLSNDGDLTIWQKNGTTVGSIFNSGTTMGVGSLDTGVLLANNIDAILPWNASTNAERDAAIDLGRSSGRFKDLYLSGTINLSTADNASNAQIFVSPSTDFAYFDHPSNGMIFRNTSGAERIKIDSSGITTFTKSGGGNIRIAETASRYVEIMGYAEGSANGSTMAFHTIQAGTSTSTERARLTSDGNLLVGGTNVAAGVGNTAVGHSIAAQGYAAHSRGSGIPLFLNRNTNDGEILRLQKDGSVVGSIGTSGGEMYLGKGDTTLLFNESSDAVLPRGTNGAQRDGAIQLGSGSNRFSDLYLSGGVYLGGTGSANKLDEYESGTFQMSASGVSGGVFGYGKYVKIGSLVHWQWYSGPMNVTGSGYAHLSGLPFAATSSTGYYSTFSTGHSTYAGTATNGYLQAGGFNAYITSTNTTSSAPYVAGNPKYVMASGTYYTDS